ncbi:hypothetical protein ANO11243_033240 [Dothideomycetidae sp. 11243]|nr:hypothetical protein ANO11243_033240 [fungal sp. No.11243]
MRRSVAMLRPDADWGRSERALDYASASEVESGEVASGRAPLVPGRRVGEQRRLLQQQQQQRGPWIHPTLNHPPCRAAVLRPRYTGRLFCRIQGRRFLRVRKCVRKVCDGSVGKASFNGVACLRLRGLPPSLRAPCRRCCNRATTAQQQSAQLSGSPPGLDLSSRLLCGLLPFAAAAAAACPASQIILKSSSFPFLLYKPPSNRSISILFRHSF